MVRQKMPHDESQRKDEKLKKKISDEVELKRREKAFDEAIENTFPASDPVSAEQPVKLSLEIRPRRFVMSLMRSLHHLSLPILSSEEERKCQPPRSIP